MTEHSDSAIVVKNLHKAFKLPHEQSSGIKQTILNFIRGIKGYETQNVLRDISFEVKKGEFFGIVGRNGSGKSTLLKLLAHIYTPDSGSVVINGSLTPFIELGVGFNPELTGRENVFLNGALLGFSKDEMEEMYEEIVTFAELERFMDQKLKNYSSGMQVRLAFSIAIKAEGDILVLDEVLAVGDEAFQKKCYQYFAEVRRKKQTVVLVTHSMDTVQQFCTRAMLIDKGHKTEIGTPLEIAQIYRELNDKDGVTVDGAEATEDQKTETKYISAHVDYTKLDTKLVFEIALDPKQVLDDAKVVFGIYRDTGEQVYRWASDERVPNFSLETHKDIRIEVDDIFPVGIFSVGLVIKRGDRTMDYGVFNEVVKFETKNLTPYKYASFWRVPDQTSIDGEKIERIN